MLAPAQPGPYRFEILATDTDMRDELHGASLFSFMQEAAYRNAEYLGMGASALDSSGRCWILLRVSVRVGRLPAWNDRLCVHTRSRGVNRLLFVRDYRFQLDGEDGFFGAASSEWLIGLGESHRPQRPDTAFPGMALPNAADTPGALPFACPKLPPVPADVPTILQKFADYSEIDRNIHVNNTRYVAWAVDALHARAADAAAETAADAAPAGGDAPAHLLLRGIDINYLSEVRPGDQVRLRRLAVDAARLEGLPPEAVVDGCSAMLIEGCRHPDGTPVFRCLLQYCR